MQSYFAKLFSKIAFALLVKLLVELKQNFDLRVKLLVELKQKN
jgi:hypothetical protein